MNHYERLEISRSASPEVIRAAYKSLMQHYHPDRNPGNAEYAKRATLIRQAYEVLSDPAKRNAYDLELQRLARTTESIEKRLGPLPARTAQPVQRNASPFYLRLMFALVLILAGMLVWTSFGKHPTIDSTQQGSHGNGETSRTQPAADTTKRMDEAPKEILASAPTVEKSENGNLAKRALQGYIKDMTVLLREASPTSAKDIVRTLTIPRITMVVGDFDTDNYVKYINNNEDMIRQRLAETLQSSRYEDLADPDRKAAYLKDFVLDAMGQITGADRFKEYPSVDPLKPAHYGTIDVEFPEGFTVR